MTAMPRPYGSAAEDPPYPEVDVELLAERLHADRAKDLAKVRDALAEIVEDMKRECEEKGVDVGAVDLYEVTRALALIEEATYRAEMNR